MSDVPEPTEAMVEAAKIGYYHRGGPSFAAALQAGIAAAPPEWLLRAALTEEELGALFRCVDFAESHWNTDDSPWRTVYAAALAKLSRALRNGEETGHDSFASDWREDD